MDSSVSSPSGRLGGPNSGEQPALSDLIPVVYQQLRRLAEKYLHRERPGQTLQPTALVHEVYLRLRGYPKAPWKNRVHFVAIAARSMRQILVERARARLSRKRGGLRRAVTWRDSLLGRDEETVDLLAMDEALNALADLDPNLSRIVELRFFGGLTVEETARLLEVSPAKVKRGWDFSRAWLRRELSP